MARPGQRAVRLAAILPPLVFLAVFGYWRFLGSDSFRVLMERLLGAALSAEVTIGSHAVDGPARISLEDLSIEFRADDGPSGVRFTAKTARARSRALLGVGSLEDVVVLGAEASFAGSPADIARLDFLKRPKGRGGIKVLRLESMTVSFVRDGRSFRVRDTDWEVDFSGGGVDISAATEALRIEGLKSAGLEEEAPEIAFGLEVDGPCVRLRDLAARGRSGWGLEGTIEADVGAETLHLCGKLDVWDLPLSRIYTPRPEVDISSSAHVEQTIEFAGPVDNVRFEVTTRLKGLTYVDRKLGLEAKGVTVDPLKKVICRDLLKFFRGLARDGGEGSGRGERRPGEAEDAGSDVQD
ncbi:MAG: hypothetical protein ACYTKD_29330 [Planctomycetota bacterium]|jgi:hypothetical protein